MKIARKKKLLLMHIAIFLVLMVLVVALAEEVQAAKKSIYYALRLDKRQPEATVAAYEDSTPLEPMTNTGNEWYSKHRLIFHAGGQIQGHTYTNSLEAIEETLAKNSEECLIEIDLAHTSDGALVCVHEWSDVFLNQKEAVTLEEFLARKIQGKYTPLTAEHLMQIMAENSQMYLVTDMKEETAVSSVISELVELCGGNPEVLSRVIIQLYTGLEKADIQKVYPFRDEQFIFTDYKLGGWTWDIPRLCSRERIPVITTPNGQVPEEDLAALKKLGFVVFEYTVNRVDMAQESLNRGISGFYTDSLVLEDVMP